MLRAKATRGFGVKELAVCLVACTMMGQTMGGRVQGATKSNQSAQGSTTKTTRLELRAPAPTQPGQAIRLTLAPTEMTDGDARPLYEEIAKLLPSKPDMTTVSSLVAKPLDELPLADVESLLEGFAPVLEQLRQAAKCRSCEWPWVEAESMSPNLDQWRYLSFLLGLETRRQLAHGQQAAALETLRTGFALAGHLAHGPTSMYGLVAVAVAARTCRDVELFMQQPGAPSLLAGLEAIPRPFINLEEQMKSEGVDEDVHQRIDLLTGRLDRHLASLRCIEALRLYAARHDNLFPETLGQITDVTIPTDPLTGNPFVYRREGDKAFLEAPAPPGGNARDALQYELSLKRN